MNNIQIVVENSAPSQKNPAKSVNWACDNILNDKKMNVADYGCGRLRNVVIMNNYFEKIYLVDTQLQCDRIRKTNLFLSKNHLLTVEQFNKLSISFDIVFLVCVLHIIPENSQRIEVINSITSKLKPNGFLVVDVPQGENYYKCKMTESNRYNDGYLLGSGKIKTFYKNYHASELDMLIMNKNEYEIYKKIYFDKHLVRIYRKCDNKNVSTK